MFNLQNLIMMWEICVHRGTVQHYILPNRNGVISLSQAVVFIYLSTLFYFSVFVSKGSI